MALITNSILKILRPLIGQSQGNVEPIVVDAGNVALTMPVFPDVARRGLAVGGTGIFQGILENVHSAADDEQSSIEPYNAGVDAIFHYPGVITTEFDLWLLRANVVRTSGVGTLPGAALKLRAPLANAPTLGFGRDDAGDPVTNNSQYMLAFWDTLFTGAAGIAATGFNSVSGEVDQKINLRLPRGCLLTFDTTSATAAATFRLIMYLGLFPAGLGQDVVT